MAYKMLVVEDNHGTSTMLKILFKNLGFIVDTIPDGSQVLPYLEKNIIDIMVLDLELPGMTGDEIYKAVRENPRLSLIPIVPFTAHRDTTSSGSLPSKLIVAEYQKTGKKPDIVFKMDENQDAKNVNAQLIKEVGFALMQAGKPITPEMADWYMETEGEPPSDNS